MTTMETKHLDNSNYSCSIYSARLNEQICVEKLSDFLCQC